MVTRYPTPSFDEDHISQVPALLLLQKLGYEYLTIEKALEMRNGRQKAVLLDGVLADQLRKINKIRFKGREHPFSEGNIHSAVQALKDVAYDGLVRTNEKIYDLLCLGRTMQQSIDGDTKSFPLRYIDWEDWKNNVFHVTEEFAVERTGSYETRRPDLVLFVNGIPLVVIECKRPDTKDPVAEAVSQHLRNQRDDEIPHLFVYTQLLLALAKNEGKYGTVGTPAKFWSPWRELETPQRSEDDLRELVNLRLSEGEVDRILMSRPRWVKEQVAPYGKLQRQVTEQDRLVYALCRPERLLEMVYRYTLFDAGERKVARYQQYFCVRKILSRIRTAQSDGTRQGGVVWHTQGSGKSLTMVMLAEALALEPRLDSFKIVLVTDRVDLDDQIYKTFNHCGAEAVKARTGRHLSQLLSDHKSRIITTVIDKFEAAVARRSAGNDNHNVFVLVDEAHRSQTGRKGGAYGELHAKMRKALPKACVIGFTGTPLIKKDKNTLGTFGGLIDTYTITQAVKDKAVVPLLYEGRHVDQKVDRESIDAWFDRVTESLSDEQRADLKRKFTTTDQLNKAQQKVMTIAWDISTHFRDTWQGTPYKAQLVTQDKSTALLYKKYLDQFDMVTSDVLISPPDDRKGNTEVEGDDPGSVKGFWKRMMDRFGSEKAYKRELISAFKKGDEPEIIIVVEMLLTGFDAPRNTVLYLTRKLEGHTLLQAIARVNRLYLGKDFGYIIDYRGVLQNLDHAFDIYGQLSEFEREDLAELCEAFVDVSVEVEKLPQRHSDLWEIFKEIENKRDEEAYERLLADESVRARFYDRLTAYSRTLAIALGSVRFIEETPDSKIDRYKRDLRFFMRLRTSVRRRYAEMVDFGEYEAKIQKLLDVHVGTGEVEQVTDLFDIFDTEAFGHEVDKLGSTASKADTIAYRTKRTIEIRMVEDPAFYRKFSELLEQAIQEFRAERLSDADYLRRVRDIEAKVRNRTGDDVPSKLDHHEQAKAFYGEILETLEPYAVDGFDPKDTAAHAGLRIDEIVRREKIVNWTNNPDVQNRMKGAIEDYLFELQRERGFELTFEDIDRLLEACIGIARVWYGA